MAREFATIEQAVEDLKAGKLILCVDDPDRENEGDLICAAEFATTENINFMAVHAKGLICMPMSGKRCDDLGLTQMVTANTDNHETAFTVSIDHMSTTTGISAVERSGGHPAPRIPQTRTHVPAAGERRRRAGPLRPHGSDGRPHAHRRPQGRGPLLRDHAGRRHHDADHGAPRVRGGVRHHRHHHRGPHQVPVEP